MSFLISCNILYFKVYFVLYEDCHSSFLLFPICMEYIFHPLSFSVYLSLCLKWVSCRQHIYGYCFCIHSASCVFWLEHLIHLHLIIDAYVHIAIFLILWGWFCRSFFLLMYFLTIQVRLTFVVKLVWWY